MAGNEVHPATQAAVWLDQNNRNPGKEGEEVSWMRHFGSKYVESELPQCVFDRLKAKPTNEPNNIFRDYDNCDLAFADLLQALIACYDSGQVVPFCEPYSKKWN